MHELILHNHVLRSNVILLKFCKCLFIDFRGQYCILFLSIRRFNCFLIGLHFSFHLVELWLKSENVFFQKFDFLCQVEIYICFLCLDCAICKLSVLVNHGQSWESCAILGALDRVGEKLFEIIFVVWVKLMINYIELGSGLHDRWYLHGNYNLLKAGQNIWIF